MHATLNSSTTSKANPDLLSVKDLPVEMKKAGRSLRKAALITGLGLIGLCAATLYLVHAMHHETTDDSYTTGHVHAVSSRVAGTVIDVAVDDNQRVNAGQVLVKLDPHDFQIGVDKAEADFDKAKADLERAEILKASHAISKQEYDQAYATQRVAQATLDDMRNQLSYCTITAPSEGVVGNKLVQTGNRLAVGSVLLSVVQDVWIVANFKETQVGKMHPGQRVKIRVDAISGHAFTGHIDSFSPGSGSTFALLPPENATGNFTKIVQRVPVKIVFDSESVRGYEDRLVPGLSVEADVDITSPGHGGSLFVTTLNRDTVTLR